jgi:OmpA-OmpF porin, OOP family
MSKSRVLALATLALSLAAAAPSSAQSIGDRLRQKAKQKVDQKTDQGAQRAVDKTADAIENSVKCAVTDKACIAKAQQDGKKVVIDSSGAAGATSSAAPAAGGPAGGASAAMRPGEGAWVNYDFVPGTRALYVDDFSKDNVGDFPRRLEFGDGNMEVAETKGARFLRVTSHAAKFSITLPEVLPERFTIEFDATPGYGSNWMILRFAEGAGDDVRLRTYSGKGMGGLFGAKHQQQGTTPTEIHDGELYRARIMADGRYVKVYMNDTRVANIPNAELGRSNKIEVEIPGTAEHPTFIGNISVMAGGKKLYDALAESGRVATQGIYFDVGSDRIRPESTPTLKEIGTMLKEHPELKLAIEGHTDNVGNAASNQSLSEKRAAAVKAFLVSSYQIDAARLTPKGLGATKPVGPNDTPEGRQTNRRVELVKM